VAQAEDTRLVRQAQDGYLDAYGELAGRHGKVAYRVALRLAGNHHDAEDIAQVPAGSQPRSWSGIRRPTRWQPLPQPSRYRSDL